MESKSTLELLYSLQELLMGREWTYEAYAPVTMVGHVRITLNGDTLTLSKFGIWEEFPFGVLRDLSPSYREALAGAISTEMLVEVVGELVKERQQAIDDGLMHVFGLPDIDKERERIVVTPSYAGVHYAVQMREQ